MVESKSTLTTVQLPVASSLPTNMGPPMAIRRPTLQKVKRRMLLRDFKGGEDRRDMCLLLLLSGDVETNPGPPKGSPAKRVKPPTEKEIMEGRVTNHDERLAALEKLVKEQKVVIDSMTKTQVELKSALDDSKVEFEKSVEENKVVSTSLEELKVNLKTRVEEQVCTQIRKNIHKYNPIFMSNYVFCWHFINVSSEGSKTELRIFQKLN